MSANDDFITQVNEINDPIKALEAINEHEDYLGYDPYYKDMRAALMNMVERVLQSHGGKP